MIVAAEMANLHNADTEGVKTKVEQGDLVLVDFWAEWWRSVFMAGKSIRS